MAIDPTLGFGTVAGSAASPVTVLDLTGKSADVVSLSITTANAWLLVRVRGSGDPYVIAAAGEPVTLAGSKSVGRAQVAAILEGFGCAAGDTASGTTVAARITTFKPA